MWKHIKECHGLEIPRFNLSEEDLVRGETCIKRPPTPKFDDIGPEPEFSIHDEEEDSNTNNNAAGDSDSGESDTSDDEREPEPKRVKTTTETPAAVKTKNISMPTPSASSPAQPWAHEHTITESVDERGNRVVTTIVKFVYGSKDVDFPCCVKKY